jgi:chaperone required for assembly of F1-ATPase
VNWIACIEIFSRKFEIFFELIDGWLLVIANLHDVSVSIVVRSIISGSSVEVVIICISISIIGSGSLALRLASGATAQELRGCPALARWRCG